MDGYRDLTIDTIRAGLREKRFSARELAEESLRLARDGNEASGTFLSFTPERAFAAADRRTRPACRAAT